MRTGRIGWLAGVVFGVGVLVQFLVLTSFAAHLWFAMDDWEFLLHRGIIPGADHGWSSPYNGHWSIVTIAIYRSLFAVVGMHSYLSYAMVTILLHLASSILVLLILRRAGAGQWVAVAAAWAVLFMGAGGDALMYSAAMNHTGAICLGLAAVWIHGYAQGGRVRTVRVVGCLLLAVMFSGTGISAVAFFGVWAALETGIVRSAKMLLVPTLAYLVWYLTAGHRQGNGYLPAEGWTYLKVPQLVWAGLSGAVDKAVGLAGIGPFLLAILLVVPFMARSAPSGLRNLAFAGNLTALLQALLVSVTRMQLDPSTTRYSYAIVIFLVPSFALCVRRAVPVLGDYRHAGWLVAALALGTYAVNGVLAERTYYESWRPITAPWPERVGGMLQAVDAGERTLTTFSGDYYNAGIDPTLMTSPRIRQSLPNLPMNATGRLTAEGMYMVDVGTSTTVATRPGALSDLDSFPGDIAQVSGCRAYRATAPHPVLVLGTGAEAAVKVESGSTQVVTTLNRNGINSGSRTWAVQPGAVYVSSTAKDALLFMTFDAPGDYTICM